MTGAQVIQLLSQNYRLPQPPNCPEQFYAIMLECWKTEPKERPAFETLQWRLEDYFETDSSSYSDTNNFVRWILKNMGWWHSKKLNNKVQEHNLINHIQNQFILTYSSNRLCVYFINWTTENIVIFSHCLIKHTKTQSSFLFKRCFHFCLLFEMLVKILDSDCCIFLFTD